MTIDLLVLSASFLSEPQINAVNFTHLDFFYTSSLKGSKMIIPVRCYSCGKVVGNMYEKYQALLGQDYTEAEALDELDIHRYCCRRMIISHVDLIDGLIPYSLPVVGTMQKLGAPTSSATPATPSGNKVG